MSERYFGKRSVEGKLTKQLSSRNVLRRKVLKGGLVVGGGVLLGLGGTFFWFRVHQQTDALYTLHQSVDGATWSPDGKEIAVLTADGFLLILDTSSYKLLHRDRIVGMQTMGMGVIRWSPNGHFIASSDPNHAVRIWNTRSWSLIADTFTGLTHAATLSWSPDSTRVAIGTFDKMVLIYHLSTNALPELVLTYAHHQDEVTTLGWSPDGHAIASGSLDGTVRVWNPSTGAAQAIFTEQNLHPITALAWSPDSQMLAFTFGPKEDDIQPMTTYVVQVHQVASRALVSTYTGHTNYIASLAWSPNGEYIASASDDTSVHIWRPRQAQGVYIYRGHTARVRTVAWAPDNVHLVTTSEDDTLQIWKNP